MSVRLAVAILTVVFVLVGAGLVSTRYGILTGGTISATSKDPDVLELSTLGQQATLLVHRVSQGGTLRQVYVHPTTGLRSFRFTDTLATQELMVIADPGVPLEEWSISQFISPKVGATGPGINLDALQIGPASAMRAITSYWNGCEMRSLMLVGEGDELQWMAFCDLPDGRVAAGTIDNRKGKFNPSPAPPAYPPPTAVPSG